MILATATWTDVVIAAIGALQVIALGVLSYMGKRNHAAVIAVGKDAQKAAADSTSAAQAAASAADSAAAATRIAKETGTALRLQYPATPDERDDGR